MIIWGSEAWKSYDVEATLMDIAIVNPRFVGIYGAPRSMVTLIIFNISIISGTASPKVRYQLIHEDY